MGLGPEPSLSESETEYVYIYICMIILVLVEDASDKARSLFEEERRQHQIATNSKNKHLTLEQRNQLYNQSTNKSHHSFQSP